MINLMRYFKGILVFPFKIFYVIVGFLVLVSLGWVDIKCDPKEAVDDTTNFIKEFFSDNPEEKSNLRDVTNGNVQSQKIEIVHSKMNPGRLIKRPVTSNEISRLEYTAKVNPRVKPGDAHFSKPTYLGTVVNLIPELVIVQCDDETCIHRFSRILEIKSLDRVHHKFRSLGRFKLSGNYSNVVVLEKLNGNNVRYPEVYVGDRVLIL